MKISIGFEKAPKKPLKYLLNGISANTMFYLINKEKMDSINFIEERDHNHLDIPYDNDDLSRCVDASLFFGWNGKDIQKAIDTAKDMNLGAHFISFLKCFEELKELLINGKRDESRKLLDEIYNSRKDIVRF